MKLRWAIETQKTTQECTDTKQTDKWAIDLDDTLPSKFFVHTWRRWRTRDKPHLTTSHQHTRCSNFSILNDCNFLFFEAEVTERDNDGPQCWIIRKQKLLYWEMSRVLLILKIRWSIWYLEKKLIAMRVNCKNWLRCKYFVNYLKIAAKMKNM